MKILIAEDEESIREVEKAYLIRAGYDVDEAETGKDALLKFGLEKYDLLILDINMPLANGLEVCRGIRKKNKIIPIIMLTAKTEEIDELIGLELGADDYIKKPFSPNVLVARVNNLLKRQTFTELQFGDLIINAEKMQVRIKEKDVFLTTTQFNILFSLAKEPGKVFTREMILDKAYLDSFSGDILDRTVDAHIKAIRKSIETSTKEPLYILTVTGKGYKFNDSL